MMKRKSLVIAGAVLVLLAAAFVYYYNPLGPRDIDKLLWSELGKMNATKNLPDADGMVYMTRVRVARKWDSRWGDIETEMLRHGASQTEARGVLANARKHFSHCSDKACFTYGVPVEAKLIWHHFQPIWIVKFRWGVGYEDPKTGLTEPPSHIRVLGISARKPYRLLGMHTCG